MSASRYSLRFPWKCPACHQHTLPVRTISTTPTRASTHDPTVSSSTAGPDSPARFPNVQTTPSIGVKPESPRYIRIPQSVQPTIEKDAWVKGTLPRPRDIFHKRHGGLQRADPANLDRMYPSRSKERGPTTPAQADVNAYRAKMADMRRKNLREGLTALARRRTRRMDRSAARYEQRAAERREILSAPPREDDRLTRVSLTKEMTAPLQHTGPYMSDANAAERQAAKVARYEAQRAAKAAETQDSLHTLYMQARDFIVTEEHLDREIDSVFGSPETPRAFQGHAPSVWAEGEPPSLQSMLEGTGQMSGGAAKERDARAKARLMETRMKKVAESLTGGKM